MSNSIQIYTVLLLISFCACQQRIELHDQSLTAINPLSYTDVEYSAKVDTALVSTFSGRIAKRINGLDEEQVVAEIRDEIYDLELAHERNELYAATLASGVVVIDPENGTVLKTLSTGSSWCARLVLSSDQNYLACSNMNGKGFLWDLAQEHIQLDRHHELTNIPIRAFDQFGNIYSDGLSQVVVWKPDDVKTDSFSISGRLTDVDDGGHALFLQDESFIVYHLPARAIKFTTSHPDWPFHLTTRDTTIRIPLSMYLTTARFAKDFIYTAGIDRSLRKWRKADGSHVSDLLGHRGTISAIDVADDERQVVSVDLLGEIRFWNVVD